MNESHKNYFARVMHRFGEIFNTTVTAEKIEAYWAVLQGIEFDEFKRISAELAKEREFFPVPKNFIDKLPSDETQHVGADEAWAIAVKTLDERETVIATDEIMQALEAARPVMELGDEVGARMAFRGAYGSLTKAGKLKWFISSGTDAALRHQRVAEAVTMGRIAAEALSVYPAIEQADPSALVSGLIGYEPKATDKEAARAALGSLREMLGVNVTSARKGAESCAGYMLSKVAAHQRKDGFALLSQQMPLNMPDFPSAFDQESTKRH